MTTDLALIPNEVIRPDAVRARAAADRACRGAKDLWEGLAELVEIQGWFALGYTSFRAWAQTELSIAGSTANQYLRKTTFLMELASETGMSIGQLEPTVKLRDMNRRRKQDPAIVSMRASITHLKHIPMLTSPTQAAVAKQLHALLADLLEGLNRCEL